MKKIITLLMCVTVILSMTIMVGAETGGSSGIDLTDPYYASTNLAKESTQREVIDNGIHRVVVSGFENGLVGEISDESHSFAVDKAAAATEIQEIREQYMEDGSISDEDYARMEELINEFYPDSSVENFLPNKAARANPGDYDSENLNLPGAVQETDYYCGPASGYAVLRGRGISVTQSKLADLMDTNRDGTILGNVAPALNTYNGQNGNQFKYSLYTGPKLSGSPQANMDATTWAINMTNNAITTIMGGYGVIYDVHQVKGSSNYLSGYSSNGVASSTMWHYVAGEGYDSSDPSNRICYYYDSNNKKYFEDRHLHVPFRVMAVLINDLGLIF